MANYYGTGRTNYVTIPQENQELVKAVAAILDFKLVAGAEGKYAFIPCNGCLDGQADRCMDVEELNEYIQDVDEALRPAVTKHLLQNVEEGEEEVWLNMVDIARLVHPEEAFIYIHSGAESARYVAGHAQLFVDGKIVHSICLNDIYGAATLHTGKQPTLAEY